MIPVINPTIKTITIIQPSIENYNEQESAQAVIEASEESKKSIGRNVNEAGNQVPRYAQITTETREQTPK